MKVVVGECVAMNAPRENLDTLDFAAQLDGKIAESEMLEMKNKATVRAPTGRALKYCTP